MAILALDLVNTVKPALKRSLVKVPEIASLIYRKLDLHLTVTSIKWTRSPFLRSQSVDFIMSPVLNGHFVLKKYILGVKYSKVKITSVTCFHK